MISLRKNNDFSIIAIKWMPRMSCAILAHVKKDVRENRVAFFTWKKVLISIEKNNVF